MPTSIYGKEYQPAAIMPLPLRSSPADGYRCRETPELLSIHAGRFALSKCTPPIPPHISSTQRQIRTPCSKPHDRLSFASVCVLVLIVTTATEHGALPYHISGMKKDDDDRKYGKQRSTSWLQTTLLIASAVVILVIGPLEFVLMSQKPQTEFHSQENDARTDGGLQSGDHNQETLQDARDIDPVRSAPKPVPATAGTSLRGIELDSPSVPVEYFHDLAPADRIVARSSESARGGIGRKPGATQRTNGEKKLKTKKKKSKAPKAQEYEAKQYYQAPYNPITPPRSESTSESASVSGAVDPSPWDTQALADLTLAYRDKTTIADYSALAVLLRTIQALRLRRAGVSDEELARALSAPSRLEALGLEAPPQRQGKPLRILYFGATAELGVVARANRGGIIDVACRSQAPCDEGDTLRKFGCSPADAPLSPETPAVCRPVTVSYWTQLKRDKLNGRMGDQKLKIQSILQRAKDLEQPGNGGFSAGSGGDYPGYDIVMVRGPPAYADSDHGRMQSIATASFAASPAGSHVFVLNCGRDTERRWSEHYFGRGIPPGDTGYNIFPKDAPFVPSTALPASSSEALRAKMQELKGEGKGVIGDTNALLPLWTEEGVRHVLGDRSKDPVVGRLEPTKFRLAERSGILCHFVRG